MTIENALERQGWRLEITETAKWIAVIDDRVEFRKAFHTDRVGKLMGSKCFVTLANLSAPAKRLIIAMGQVVENVQSTSGRGAEYPGFDSSQVPGDILSKFAEDLRHEVDSCMQK